MTDATYYFNSKSTSVWTDPEKMVDSILTNYATTVSDGDTEVLNGNSCPGSDLGTITKVEIRAYAYGDGDDRIDLVPVFTGGDGDEHQTTPANGTPGWGAYQDVTSDTNYPSPWTWSAVQTLDCKVEYDKVAAANTMHCAKVEIRVTYTEVASWLSGYTYRKKGAANSTTAGAQTNYQKKLLVGETSGAASEEVDCEGHCLVFPDDIRFTKEDGTTKHDYWVESLSGNTPNRLATIQIEVASIPASGDVDCYMYYGKSGDSGESNGDNAFLFFDDFNAITLDLYAENAASAKISTSGYLAENIVYDSSTSKYWWIFEDRSSTPYVARLAWATSITGSWTVESGAVISETGHMIRAPHIVKFGSYWYIYYERGDVGDTSDIGADIWVQKSSTVNSGYSETGISNPILSRVAATWESVRVTEPFVFLEDGTYYLFYMADAGNPSPANTLEKVGYATSSSPTSGYSKYGSNPVLPADGHPHGWDSGYGNNLDYAADPFVFKKDSVFYIGITAKGSIAKWQIGFYTTTDFVNFTHYDYNPVLGIGVSGNWDDNQVIRGAVTLFGSIYYFPYAGHDGSNWRCGMTTLQFEVERNELDINKWGKLFSPSVSISNSIVSVKQASATSNITRIQGLTSFGTCALRTKAKVNLITGTNGREWGMAGETTSIPSNMEEFEIWNGTQQVISKKAGTTEATGISGITANTLQIYDILFVKDTSAKFYLDEALKDTDTVQIPNTDLYPFLGVYSSAAYITYADWIAIRKYIFPEPTWGSWGAEEGGAMKRNYGYIF